MPRGPRIGWRLALVLLFPTVFTWIYFVHLTGRPVPVRSGVYLAGKILQFSLPLLLARGLPSRSRRPPRGSVPRSSLAPGAVFGLVAGGLALAAAFAGVVPEGLAGAVRAKVAGFGLATPGRYLALALFYSIGHSFLEEYYWRGFAFARLRDRMPRGAAIGLSSAAFAAHHLVVLGSFLGPTSPIAWALTAAVAGGGVVWALLHERRRSLPAPWLSHALVDAGVFGAGYVLIFGG